jgi:predicted nucleic acid-binding protein
MFLIDTNVISEVRRGGRANTGARRWMNDVDPETTFTSVIVFGELIRGVELVKRRDLIQSAVLARWVRGIRDGFGTRVLPVDERVMETWARISVPNPLKGLDGLIGATALVHSLVVVTRNVSDFQKAGVPVLNPFD